jgi:hypothetical protein
METYPRYQLPSGNWTTDRGRADRLWAKERGTTVDAVVMGRYRAARAAYDPLCCQRYGRLHLPEFSVPGCRWHDLKAGSTEGQAR